MTQKQGLDSFLASLSHGKVMESGEFQVDASERLRKLGAVLRHSDEWLVKVLQAVHHWRAQSVEIKIKRRTLTFLARGISPEQPLNCTTVFNHDKGWRGHYHLFAALLTLINNQNFTSCSFQWRTGEASHELTFQGENMVKASDVEREESGRGINEFGLSLTKSISTKAAFKNFWKADFGDIPQLVQSRCQRYTIPIGLDGRPLAFPKRITMKRSLAKGGGLILDEWAEQSSGLLGVQVFYDPGGKGVADNLAPGNYLAWIQDGVVADYELESRRKDSLNVITFVDGQGLANDLTTLQIRDSEEKRERLKRISEGLDWRAQVLNSLRWSVSNGMPPDPGKYRGPILKTEVLSAIVQSASHEKYRSEHHQKLKVYQQYQRIHQEAIWLARHGARLRFEK